jgi:hypothetical protein
MVGEEAGVVAEGSFWRGALGLALAFGAPGLGLLLWRGLRARGGAGFTVVGGPGRERGYCRAFIEACRRRGVSASPGTTLKGWVAGLGEVPEFAGELVGYHYGVNYEGRPRDEVVEGELKRKAEAWGRSLAGRPARGGA